MSITTIGADAAKLAGLQIDTLQKVRAGQITLDHWEWFNGLTKDERDVFLGAPAELTQPAPQSILHLISGEEKLVLDATDGKAVISNASYVFDGYIDPDFRYWGANEASGPTPETPVAVHEIVKGATFKQMFNSLGAARETLCLTHSQIIGFAKKHRDWLQTDGYATFFLFQSEEQFFVAYVQISDDDKLGVHVYRFRYDRVWSAECRHRVIVLQL